MASDLRCCMFLTMSPNGTKQVIDDEMKDLPAEKPIVAVVLILMWKKENGG